MTNPFRIFGLLLHKNLIVRKRHWKVTIFLQALVPIALFVLIQAVRDFSVKPARVINESTYYPLYTKEELIQSINQGFTYLFYVPKDPYTEKIMQDARSCLNILDEKMSGFDSEEDMINAYISLQTENPITNVLAVVLTEYNTNDIVYKIRHPLKIPAVLYQNIYEQTTGMTRDLYFRVIPFAQVQICVDGAFINTLAPNSTFNTTRVSIQQMPYPPYIKIDEIDIVLRLVMCTFAVIAFLIPLCIESNYPAQEKFIGVNVLMAMNGVKMYQNLLSWLVTGIICSMFYVLPILVLFKITFSGNVDSYLYYSNAFIFWLLLTTHVTHLITFGMHVSAYFSKPRFVVITLSIIYTASFSLHGNLIKEECFCVIPYLGILFPNILLYRLLEEVNAYESKLLGVQWSNLFIAGDSQYGIAGSSGFILLFSILGIILHFTLSVYINAILPGKYGVRKELLYFLKCIKKNKVCLDQEPMDFDYDKVNNEDFEPVERGALIPGIQIRGLKKTYRTVFPRKSTVHALKGISMDLYKGQITALLGHNGAGKTTLMSILTGLTSATEGNVFVNGKSIRKDLESIRDDLGLCPQENMVFPDLNVFEQLEFFGLLKGANKSRKEIRQNVTSLLSKLKLSEKKNVIPSKLSGGQKRRLCLGMALIGDASIIILDEPTSGMDPETRRDTWDITLKMRGEKTILISTHNMEEADILGDRIAIIHGGRLRSYGTSMFLKKQYGHGRVEVTLSTKSWCEADKVAGNFDSKTELVVADKEKIVLSIPYTDSLPLNLDKVESEKKKLGVTGISVSLITLEEVFLKIVKKNANSRHLSELFGPPPEKITGLRLCMQQVLALYEKKFTYTRKNLSNLLMIVLLPILAVLLMGLSYDIPNDSTEEYPLAINIYRYAKAFYTSNNDTYRNTYKQAVEHFGHHAEFVPQDTNLTDALLNAAVEDIAEYRNYIIASAEFDVRNDTVYANAFYSGNAIHSVPISINLLSNALIKSVAGAQYSIRVSSQKLPHTLISTRIQVPEAESLSRVLIFCSFFFPTIALFVVHPLQEVTTKVKQLQRMTGVSSVSYWLTLFSFDLIIFLVAVCVIVFGFYIMDVILDIRLYRKVEIFTMILLLFLFGINALLVAYIFSFINKSRNIITTILSLAPLGLAVIQYLLQRVLFTFDNLKILHVFQKRLFRLIPHISLFHGQLAFFDVAINNARCRRLPNRLQDVVCFGNDICCGLECMDGECKSPLPYIQNFENDFNLEESIVYLSVTPLLYFAILIMLEEKVFARLFMKIIGTKLKSGCDTMDEQVKKEKHAVAIEINKLNTNRAIRTANTSAKAIGSNQTAVNSDTQQTPENEISSLFLVYELSKYYGKLMAVKEINFRVKQRECFGLLGVNGAGKSTTFRMLTGEEMPNSGIMYLGKSEMHSDRKNYFAQMGYCPQTDALLDALNSFDHLRLFGLLRGIPKSKLDVEVNKWINRLDLTACMSQPSSTYSGGNKRRLNIAMALIANPTLVLLDEPTTGVDPAARRSLWSILQSCQAAGQAIILTSHSMEECEALCNRLVIMVRGQLVCIGASQELKQRFGAGYDIHIKLCPSRSDEDVVNIKKTIESSLTCDIRDENLGFIAYHVTDSQTSWEKMYSTIRNLKVRYNCIEDYAVLSATLEQLFIQFARGAETTTDKHTGTSTSAASQSVIV